MARLHWKDRIAWLTCLLPGMLAGMLPGILLAQQAPNDRRTPAGPTKLSGPLFTQLSAKQTGINFLNKIVEDDSLNIMTYEYLYNGAGVGVADFNNDGLNDIFFSSNTGPDKLYLNKGNLTFQDVTREAHITGNGTWSTGVSVADVNGDGLLDIYVCHSGKYDDSTKLSNELFICQGIKNGVPVYKDMAKEYGLDAPGS